MRTLVKNKIFNLLLLKSVTLVKEVVLNQVLAQTDVPIVEETEELDPIKAFLLFNKLVLNVLGVVKK